MGASQITTILDMMELYQIEELTRARVTEYHDQALAALKATGLPDTTLAPLVSLTQRLQHRTS
jgi:hypothetical protein